MKYIIIFIKLDILGVLGSILKSRRSSVFKDIRVKKKVIFLTNVIVWLTILILCVVYKVTTKKYVFNAGEIIYFHGIFFSNYKRNDNLYHAHKTQTSIKTFWKMCRKGKLRYATKLKTNKNFNFVFAHLIITSNKSSCTQIYL